MEGTPDALFTFKNANRVDHSRFRLFIYLLKQEHLNKRNALQLQLGEKIAYPANTKHLYNICTTSAQRRRWSNIVQMLYKCFVFTG